MKNVTPTTTQQTIIEDIAKFLDSQKRVFILKGYAGTGKTTMIQFIIDILEDKKYRYLLMAPTGRAAKVLNEKTHRTTTTIHRGIYNLERMVVEERQNVEEEEPKFIFPVRVNVDRHVMIIDEASMVSSRKSENDMMQFGSGILLDDIFTSLGPNGKVVFIGDPAQLPPVGDNQSAALDVHYFEKYGMTADCAELREVLRQQGDSLILKNAMKIRQLLQAERRNELVFETDDNEVTKLQPEDMVSRYVETQPEPALNNSVIITFSNRAARDYNIAIRHAYFPQSKDITARDVLMVVHNNYRYDLMNGDFVQVDSIDSEKECINVPVFVTIGMERKRVTVTLCFCNATLLAPGRERQKCKLLLSLLDSKEPALTLAEMTALYVYVRMRYPRVKPGTKAFADIMMNDPYYTALHVKYGYAVTGHKCQGGEWEQAFVDFTGRTGLNDDCLRWTYTATTRASRHLFGLNMPDISPLKGITFHATAKVSKAPNVERYFAPQPDTPFHGPSAAEWLKAKFWAITESLTGTDYQIVNVKSQNYQEQYFVQTPDGTLRFDLFYKKGGYFSPAKAECATATASEVADLMNVEDHASFIVDYASTDDVLQRLHNQVQSVCDELGIAITAIDSSNSHQYVITYHFKTSGLFSYVRFFYTQNGSITSAMPSSDLGSDDTLLNMFIQRLSACLS